MSRTRIQRHSRLRQLTYQLTLLASVIMLYNLLWAHSRLTSSSVPDMTSAARIGFLLNRRQRRQRKRIENAIQQQLQSTGSTFSATTITDADNEKDNDTDETDADCLPPIQRLSDIRSCAMKTTAASFSSASHATTRTTTNDTGFLLHSLPEKCRQSIATWQDVQTCLIGRRYHHHHGHGDNDDETKASMGSSSIKHVHIIGERNSGTKFVTSEIQQCFSSSSTMTISTNYSFRIHRDFIRSKHFFQPILWQEDYSESFVIVVVRNPIDWVAAMRQHPYHSPCHLKGFVNNTSPTTTITGRRRRRDMSNIEPVALEWEEFLNKPWTMPRQGEPFDLFQPRRLNHHHHHQKATRTSNDHPMITTWKNFASTTPYMEYMVYNNNSNMASRTDVVVGVGGGCNERLQTNEVVPCIYDKNATYFVPAERLRGYEPVYELKRKRRRKPSQRKNDDIINIDKNAYENILDLRADKIYNFVLELPLYMKLGGFLVVRYEDLLRNGTLPLLQQVANMVLQEGDNNSTIPLGAEKQQQQQQDHQPLLPPQCRPTAPQPDRLLHRRGAIPMHVRTWIEQNINVETERLLGYYSDATQSLE